MHGNGTRFELLVDSGMLDVPELVDHLLELSQLGLVEVSLDVPVPTADITRSGRAWVREHFEDLHPRGPLRTDRTGQSGSVVLG